MQILAFGQKVSKKMQVICKSLRLARYEQETPTKKGGGQCATKEKNLENAQPKRGINMAL